MRQRLEFRASIRSAALAAMIVLSASGASAHSEAPSEKDAALIAEPMHEQVKPISGPIGQRIKEIAGGSSCAKYSWKNRGRAPAGYVKGIALSFARGLCRLKTSHKGPALVMSSADSQNASKDVLAHYRSKLLALDLIANTSGGDTLRIVYAIAVGLGMRESSGKYCTGWDTSAGANRPSASGEAGVFQASYDSINSSPELRKLYDEYRSTPQRCFLDTFKEGVSCRNQSILGTGAGATFQVFSKSCPAFATEYTAVLLRVLRRHFGPINRLEAEVQASCNVMLRDVQRLVEANTASACEELY